MARVFDVPRYKDQSMRSLRAYASLCVEDLDPRLVVKYGIPSSDQAYGSLFDGMMFDMRYIYEALGEEIPEELRQDEFTHQLFINKRMPMSVAVGKSVCAILEHYSMNIHHVYHDSDAIYKMCFNIWSGRWENVSKRHTTWSQAAKAAASLAILGTVGDKINVVGARHYHGNGSLFDRTFAYNERLGKAFVCSEAFRLAFDNKAGRDHLKLIVDQAEDIDISQFEIKYGHLKESFPTKKFYRIFSFAFIIDGRSMYIMDGASLNELHQTLRTPFGFLAYAMGYQPAVTQRNLRAMDAFNAFHNYTLKAMSSRFNAGRTCESLAKQMKESYAVLLAHVGSRGAAELEQIAAISNSANEVCETEEPFYPVLLNFDEEISIDLGTYWNVLPAPDADPELMDARLQRVMNAPRQCDELLFRRFIRYSRSILTAHIICKKKDAFDLNDWVFNIDIDDPRELPWVINCARGVLDYPPEDQRGRVYVTKVLRWDMKMENWHFAAQDVTHVFADLSRYESIRTISAISRVESSELSYALIRGPMLSDRFTPQQVRIGMENGRLPGQRVLVLAAKRENTKFGEKVRETASGDDILREALSELDYNAQQIARSVHGVALRMGRMGFEKRMERMKTRAEDGQVYISLDVSGWSPNMIRRNQMEFVDMLMDFYDIPDDMRASNWFDEINVVHSRRGFHSIWEMADGSVQGFFGGCDSIMHNMLAQFAKVIAQEEGVINLNSKVDFMTLIDDLAIKILNCDRAVIPILRSFESTYRRLGFETDLVKTLVSDSHFHFLNRLFGPDGEVITASKIFAKSGREYDRRFASVWAHIDSSMGSVLGSVDRGCSVITGYEWALTHATKAAVDSNKKVLNDGWSLTHFGAWLPRVFGGWGLPGVISWTTQEGIDPIPNGICHIQRILDRVMDSVEKDAIKTNLYLAVSQPLAQRKHIQAITNPFGLAVVGVPDPEAPGRRIMREGAAKVVKSPDFQRLLAAGTGEEFDNIIAELVATNSYPMEIWAAFADTLPMAILEKIINRAEQNEIVVMSVRPDLRHKAINEIKRLNERAIRHYKTIVHGEIDEVLVDVRGSALIGMLRHRQLTLDGIRATDLQTTPSLEVVAHTLNPHAGCIKATQPKLRIEEIYRGRYNWSLQRTFRGTSAIIDHSDSIKMHDPVARSIFSLSIVVSAVRAMGGTALPLISCYSSVWFGDPAAVILPNIEVTATDPRRICSRTSNLSHSIMSYPNFAGAIRVNASIVINKYESVKRTFDWLSVITAVRGLVATDTEYRLDTEDNVNYRGQVVYHFNMSGHTGFFRDDSPPIERLSEKYVKLCSTAKGILDKLTRKYVLGLIGVIPNKLRGFSEQDESYNAIHKEFGYAPAITKIVYSAFELLQKRSLDKTIIDDIEMSTYSPLTDLDKSIISIKKVQTYNTDVVGPSMSKTTLTKSQISRVASAPGDKTISLALITYAQRINGCKKKPIKDEFWVTAHEDMKQIVVNVPQWKDILENWGNGHFYDLIATKEIDKRKNLYDQIVIDLDHPKAEGFTKTGKERFNALMSYAKTYDEESNNLKKSRAVRYKKRFESLALKRLASAAIVNIDVISTVVDVGEALNDDISTIVSREFAFIVKVNPSSRAIVWMSNAGIWAKDYQEALNRDIPNSFKAKRDIISGLMWALNNLEQWIEKDLLIPEAKEDYARYAGVETGEVTMAPEVDLGIDFDNIDMGTMGELVIGEEEYLSDNDDPKDMIGNIDFASDLWLSFARLRGIGDITLIDSTVLIDFINENKRKMKDSSAGKSDVV
nr:MAG: putative RNA-dependent RNA polymerase [Ilomantsi qinvirus]